MKTAISIPDPVFAMVEERIRALGMTRSEFYAQAAVRFMGELDRASITARLDAAIDAAGSEAEREQREWARGASAALAAGDDW